MVNLGHLQVGNFVNWEDAKGGPVLRLQKTHAGRAVWVDLTEQEVYLLQSFLGTYLQGLESSRLVADTDNLVAEAFQPTGT